MNAWFLISSFGIIAFLVMSNNLVFAQEQNIDEFLEWPSENNYDSILISIVVLIALAILGNYLWSKRKGRRYSEE